MIFAQLEVNKIYSIDIDESVEAPSKRLCPEQVKEDKFISKALDVNKLLWEDNTILYTDHTKRDEQIKKWHVKNDEKLKQGIITEKDKKEAYANMGRMKMDNINLVINTSCEHMDNTWFDNLPEGQAVALQTNDYFDNDQHVNCCKGLEEVKNKYKFSTILYEGSLDTVLYERYMLIGIK